MEQLEQYDKVLLAISHANKVLQEKQEKVSALETREKSLSDDVKTHEGVLSSLQERISTAGNHSEARESELSARATDHLAAIDAEREKIIQEREDIQRQRDQLAEDTHKYEILVSEGDRLSAENQRLASEIKAKESTMRTEASYRKDELAQIEASRQALAVETMQLERVQKDTQDAQIKLQQDQLQRSSYASEVGAKGEALAKLHEEVTQKSNQVNQEIQTLDRVRTQGSVMVSAIKQEFIRLAQVHGINVKIPNFTDEHRRILIDALTQDLTTSQPEV